MTITSKFSLGEPPQSSCSMGKLAVFMTHDHQTNFAVLVTKARDQNGIFSGVVIWKCAAAKVQIGYHDTEWMWCDRVPGRGYWKMIDYGQVTLTVGESAD